MSIFEKSIKQKIEEAKKNPVTILAFAYPYLLVIGLVIGLLYVTNFNSIARKNVLPPLPDTSAVVQDLPVKQAVVIPPVDVMKMKNPTPELVAEGKDLYSANCSSCHGTDGKGDGPASAGLNPPPRNYTSNANWVNGRTTSDIYKTLQEGIKGSAMASYSYMNPEDLFALAAYIRATFMQKPPEDTDSDLMMLDLTYNLSQGKKVPAQIPTSLAEDIIVKENADRYQKIQNTIRSINNDTNDAGAKIFKDVTINEIKALAILSNTPDWKKNEQSFITLVVNEVHQDGFNGKVFNLNSSEWDTLYKYLSKYM
jgi:mono/diheme cytochrome c family protein